MAGFSWLQIMVGVLTAVGVPALLSPELKKVWDFITGMLPNKPAPTLASTGTTVGLIEAAQAAETLKQWYGCRCTEAQAKLQIALTHFHDPVVKPVVPNMVDPAIAAQVNQVLAARASE